MLVSGAPTCAPNDMSSPIGGQHDQLGPHLGSISGPLFGAQGPLGSVSESGARERRQGQDAYIRWLFVIVMFASQPAAIYISQQWLIRRAI